MKFEALIENYNAGSRSIEELFAELLKLSNSLDDEQQRHVRENMSEEDLVISDILTRPAPELSPEERTEVKKGGVGAAGAVESAAGAQLAAEIGRSLAAQADHRRHPRHRPAARLHAGAVPAEMRGGVRACVRELPGAECGCLCNGSVRTPSYSTRIGYAAARRQR
ncbi:MAG: hypothetical protein U1F70_04870 [Candidatus Competibacteraceae bacterium]